MKMAMAAIAGRTPTTSVRKDGEIGSDDRTGDAETQVTRSIHPFSPRWQLLCHFMFPIVWVGCTILPYTTKFAITNPNWGHMSPRNPDYHGAPQVIRSREPSIIGMVTDYRQRLFPTQPGML